MLCGAFPFDNHFETCLQNGSIFCICRSASNLSAVRDFGVVFCVSVTSGATVHLSVVWHLQVSCAELSLLLVLNAGSIRVGCR